MAHYKKTKKHCKDPHCLEAATTRISEIAWSGNKCGQVMQIDYVYKDEHATSESFNMMCDTYHSV